MMKQHKYFYSDVPTKCKCLSLIKIQISDQANKFGWFCDVHEGWNEQERRKMSAYTSFHKHF